MRYLIIKTIFNHIGTQQIVLCEEAFENLLDYLVISQFLHEMRLGRFFGRKDELRLLW